MSLNRTDGYDTYEPLTPGNDNLSLQGGHIDIVTINGTNGKIQMSLKECLTELRFNIEELEENPEILGNVIKYYTGGGSPM